MAADDTLNSVYTMSLQELKDINRGNPKRKDSFLQRFSHNRVVPTLFPIKTNPTFPAFALRVSDEGVYSVSRPDVSLEILKHIKKQYTRLVGKFTDICIMDATANNGGDTIRFGLDPDINKVVSIEINDENFKILQHNVRLYEFEKQVQLIQGNMTQYIGTLDYDILYVDPPWGGLQRVLASKNKYLTLHLAAEEAQYTPENEVFKVIVNNPGLWKLCCVKVPATIPSHLLLQQVQDKFDSRYTISIHTISPAEGKKCGVKIVIITKIQHGSGRKKSTRTKRMRAKRSRRIVSTPIKATRW